VNEGLKGSASKKQLGVAASTEWTTRDDLILMKSMEVRFQLLSTFGSVSASLTTLHGRCGPAICHLHADLKAPHTNFTLVPTGRVLHLHWS
jgi:hypothetical protein